MDLVEENKTKQPFVGGSLSEYSLIQNKSLNIFTLVLDRLHWIQGDCCPLVEVSTLLRAIVVYLIIFFIHLHSIQLLLRVSKDFAWWLGKLRGIMGVVVLFVEQPPLQTNIHLKRLRQKCPSGALCACWCPTTYSWCPSILSFRPSCSVIPSPSLFCFFFFFVMFPEVKVWMLLSLRGYFLKLLF